MRRRGFVQGVALAVASGGLARAAGSRIRVGQIGTVHAHAVGKMATLRKFSDVYDVVGVVEDDDAQWKRVEGRAPFQGLRRLTEDQLFDVAGLQAVVVETEIEKLIPTAKRCVSEGLHVHIDKPAGSTLPPFVELQEIAAKNKAIVQMGYMLRYNPAFQLCFRAVKEGWLGDVFELHAVMSKSVGAGARRELAAYPGGSMFELGCHIIDSAVFVLGKPEKVTPHLRKTRPADDDLADNTLAVLEYPRATATIRSSLVEYEGGARRQFVVCGSEGTVDIKPLEPPSMRLALSEPRDGFKRGYQAVDLPESPGRYDGEFVDLAKIIRGEKEPDFSREHDLAVQETVLRASGMPLG